MCAAFGIAPNDILDAPPEIQDELERVRDHIARQKNAGSNGVTAPLPSSTLREDEIIRAIEQAEFGLAP